MVGEVHVAGDAARVEGERAELAALGEHTPLPNVLSSTSTLVGLSPEMVPVSCTPLASRVARDFTTIPPWTCVPSKVQVASSGTMTVPGR